MLEVFNKLLKKFKLIENLSFILFFIASILYITISYYFFLLNINNSDYFSKNLNYVSLIAQNLEKKFKEKNLEIKFENQTFSTNIPEPIILETLDTKITEKKNLLYISKSAEDKDLKEKNTLMIMNSRDLKIDLGTEPIIYPLETMEGIKRVINGEELSKFNQQFYLGSQLFNSIGLNFILIFKSFEIIFLLFISNFILIYFVYAILYLSGYKNIDAKAYKSKSLIAISIYIVLKAPFSVYLFEPSLLSTLLILAVLISINEKSKLEKN